jgi:hydroxypyruvate isomerase
VRTSGLRFDVNCSILFTELPLLKRPEAARAAGFDAVEFWWPFAGVTNVGFLADLYHLGKMGEDLPATLAREAASIAHIQVADVPDRGAPGTGELDYEALFDQLARQGYAGWIGCEYKPSDPADSSTSFGWREPDAV